MAASASPLASRDWFLQFHTKACIRFTPPIRRLLSAQYPGNRQIYPRGCERLRFWQCLKPFDASPRVCSRSSLECSPTRISFGFLIQRSPPRLLNAAAWIGLGPAPESRSRGARPHLSCSLSPRSVVHCKLPSMCICSKPRIRLSDKSSRFRVQRLRQFLTIYRS